MVSRWIDIKDRFSDAIIIGNGGSRSVSGAFSYGSLLEKARKEGFVNEDVNRLFDIFDTDDFENLLRKLWYAKQINSVLQIECDVIDEAYETVQGALILAVRSAHCDYRDALPYLGNIGQFLSQFETVFSLNYDLITYWAIMNWNDSQASHSFKDCFINSQFKDDWSRLRRPIRGEERCSLIFYPHGTLFLTIEQAGIAKKITNAENDNFLEAIISYWEEEKQPPLIICDGDSNSKKRNILNNKYLSNVYLEALPKSGPSLTIYGWDMGRQEQHIIDQIVGNYERIACSVYQPKTQQGADFMAKIERKLRPYNIELFFFDSECAGCWIHETIEDAAE